MVLRISTTRRTAASTLVLVFALAAPAALAEDPEAFVDRLQERFDRLVDLRAEFTQRYESGELGTDEAETGRVVVAKPGRMRWDYTAPESKVAVVDGAWSWIYFVEDAEVECHRTEGVADGSPLAAFLGGEVDLREEFAIEVAPARKGERTVVLRPRRLSEHFDEVRLTVDRKTLSPRRLAIVDPVGSLMEFVFEDVRENQGVPPGFFEPGTAEDVVWNGDCGPWRRDGSP